MNSRLTTINFVFVTASVLILSIHLLQVSGGVIQDAAAGVAQKINEARITPVYEGQGSVRNKDTSSTEVTTAAPAVSNYLRERLQNIFEGWVKAPRQQAAKEEASRLQILMIINGILNGALPNTANKKAN